MGLEIDLLLDLGISWEENIRSSSNTCRVLISIYYLTFALLSLPNYVSEYSTIAMSTAVLSKNFEKDK